jgi:ABC-type polar amino acid transport system ATPase subunit
MAKVLLENVCKIYPGDVTAVHDASLEIEDREFVVLVGPSGCGKSTTLRMIAGLEEISRGAIFIDGKKVNDVPPKDRDIAMVFQNYALYPHMTVYNNMAFGLKLRRYPKAEIHRRVMEAADILGIADYLERKPKALSGGQRQRVAVGRAIVRKPKAFLFDEPLSHRGDEGRLDPAGGHAPGPVQPAGQPVRRRVHRQSAHEFLSGPDSSAAQSDRVRRGHVPGGGSRPGGRPAGRSGWAGGRNGPAPRTH